MSFEIKDDIVLEDVMILQPKVLIVLGHLMMFAEKRNLPVVVTSVISDRGNTIATSRTHEDGRAIDVSTVGWGKLNIIDAMLYVGKVAGHYGAISASDLERRVIIHHNYKNQGDHFHLQVSR